MPRLVVSTGDLATRLEQRATRPTTEATPEAAAEVAVAHTRQALANEYVAPRNQAERAIVEIWQELLGLAPVGVEDDFFELGGHSLLALQLSGEIKKRLHVNVPLQAFFNAPTIAELCAHIGSSPKEPV